MSDGAFQPDACSASTSSTSFLALDKSVSPSQLSSYSHSISDPDSDRLLGEYSDNLVDIPHFEGPAEQLPHSDISKSAISHLLMSPRKPHQRILLQLVVSSHMHQVHH